MSLYSTPYPNPTRTIAGVAQLYEDDVVLAVDTTALACSITLLEIPENRWNTNWKLYLVPTQTVLSNSITIVAGAGQTINGAASVVFPAGPSNRIKITISSNNSFMAEIDSFSPVVPVVDSGWVNLLGFDHLARWDKRPQFRIVGKILYFRGIIIVPCSNSNIGESLLPITLNGANGFYSEESYSFVFQGRNGVTLDNGILYFNKNFSLFPAPFNNIQIENETSWGLKMLTRTLKTSSGNLILYNSLGELVVKNDGKILLKAYENLENSNQNLYLGGGDGLGGARQIITNVIENQFVVDWNSAGAGSATNSSITRVTGGFTRDFLVTSNQIRFTTNSGLAENLGGFQLILDGFYTFIS